MAKVTTLVVGAGGMARWHLRTMLAKPGKVKIVGLVEPDAAAIAATAAVFSEFGLDCPPSFPTIKQFLKAGEQAATALICTPHKFHYPDTRDCLKAGLDVCLEKPMVMSTAEARNLIRLRNQTGRLVVVAFPGSLSPAIQKAKNLLARGAVGRITAISAFAHQNWCQATAGTWRQEPELSGGGFLFDTGSHMVNTVVDLLGEDVVKVGAILENCGAPVEINSTVSATSSSGVTISLLGAGHSTQCCSQVTVCGDKGILKTGIWGECLQLKKETEPDFKPVPYKASMGPWEQFIKVREGKRENPCPPEVGLRFARLMDMIRKSAETGQVVTSK